jgi:type II secretory pathway component PulJ
MTGDSCVWTVDSGSNPTGSLRLTGDAWRLDPRSRIRAFTLLEVLIAIALILALGAALFGFLHDMLATRSRTLDHALQQRAAATLIERLEADVVATLVGDTASGPGVQGDATNLRLLTRGVMPQLASRGLDDPAPLGDLQSVEFRFDPSARRLEARRSSASAGEAPPEFATLGGAIAHVRFRYLGNRRWQQSFDSLALGHLPAAIEVAVWFTPWPEDREAQAEADADASSGAPAVDSAGEEVAPGNFDEGAFGMTSDSESQRRPTPDRLRVIVIPDGGADDAAAATQAADGAPGS